jgi:hypothetical protein
MLGILLTNNPVPNAVERWHEVQRSPMSFMLVPLDSLLTPTIIHDTMPMSTMKEGRNMRNKDFYDNENAEGLVFENAIEQNKLSLDLDDDKYVGRYMYMHSTLLDDDQIIDHFKNRDTRAYDVVGLRKGSPARPTPR